MKKKSIVVVMVLVMLFSCTSIAQARASEYVRNTTVSAYAGNESGEIKIYFSINAVVSTTRIGASSIEVYESNGDYVTTIWGNTSNGLISTAGGRYYSYTYTYTGTPGTTYYFIVNCYAGNSNGSDIRERETNLVRASY